MPEVVSAARSRNMAAIRSKNTRPEIIIRKHLHRRGFRFRVHAAIPGKPDIVFPKHNALIFVNGCFWHGHDCRFFKLPKTRREFWERKISENRKRDDRVVAELKAEGWRQLIVWECALRGEKAPRTLEKIEKWILSRRKLTEI